MAKPTGFMEYQREEPKDRLPIERICDYNEFHEHFDEKKRREQAARCMDCGIPFCHTGILINRAASGCPINNLIPEWNELIYKGLWDEAYRRLSKTNNFPEFTGRVCPAPCEGACTVGLNDTAVTIKQNECRIIDRAFEEGVVAPFIPAFRSGKKIAVIGSGPAGLACADQLNKAGHEVTVYERSDRPGGLLMYGIPNMKLEKSVVMRRVELMEQSGIRFQMNKEIGKDIGLEQLTNTHDAVILCCGATRARDLNVPGRDAKGIYFAVDFLTQNTRALLSEKDMEAKVEGCADSPSGAVSSCAVAREDAQSDCAGVPEGALSAKGKNVIIIGGGDTGTDCVGTALRHGAKSVTQIEIMPRPSDTRPSDNPWPQWPMTLKTDYGQQEAIAITGKDPRVWETTVRAIHADKKGRIKSVETVEVQWQNAENGAMIPKPIEGTEKTLPADLVLLAMGFLGPEDHVLGDIRIERDARGNFIGKDGIYQSDNPKIFAAGDARRGQSLVVWAIYEGRAAAARCDAFLMGKTHLPG